MVRTVHMWVTSTPAPDMQGGKDDSSGPPEKPPHVHATPRGLLPVTVY